MQDAMKLTDNQATSNTMRPRLDAVAPRALNVREKALDQATERYGPAGRNEAVLAEQHLSCFPPMQPESPARPARKDLESMRERSIRVSALNS